MISEQWTAEVISSRMVPLKWTRRDDMHCFDELDPLWKPLLANARMVFIAYLVLQAKNLSKCARFLAQTLEISHISRVFFPAFTKGTENKYLRNKYCIWGDIPSRDLQIITENWRFEVIIWESRDGISGHNHAKMQYLFRFYHGLYILWGNKVRISPNS